MQTIYGLGVNCGDGSYCIRWFRNEELADRLLAEEDEYMYEDCPTETLTFPADLDLEQCGFSFSDEDYD